MNVGVITDRLAPLWPFIGICIEAIILTIIIIVYEKQRAKQNADEDSKEEAAKNLWDFLWFTSQNRVESDNLLSTLGQSDI